MPVPAMTVRDLDGIAGPTDIKACHLEILRRRAIIVAKSCRAHGLARRLGELPAVTSTAGVRAWATLLMSWQREWQNMGVAPRENYKLAYCVAGEMFTAILLLAEARIAEEPSA